MSGVTLLSLTPVVLNLGCESHMRLPSTLCSPCDSQQSFSKTCNILCNRLHSTIKQNVSVWLVLQFLVWICSKIVGPDLGPCSEMVENHWFRTKRCYLNNKGCCKYAFSGNNDKYTSSNIGLLKDATLNKLLEFKLQCITIIWAIHVDEPVKTEEIWTLVIVCVVVYSWGSKSDRMTRKCDSIC